MQHTSIDKEIWLSKQYGFGGGGRWQKLAYIRGSWPSLHYQLLKFFLTMLLFTQKIHTGQKTLCIVKTKRPVVGALGQTYGVRRVTFWGGLIAAAGSILCSFAPTVTWIVFFWGCIHGLGFSLACTLFQHIINLWFERHRATASGLVLSGACAASIVYPIMLRAMLDNYGVVGCFLLLGGLFLNTLPPALVLKVPSWIEFPTAYARQRELILKSSSCVGDIKSRQPPARYQTAENTANICWKSPVCLNDAEQMLQPDRPKTRSRALSKQKTWFGTKEEKYSNKQVICTLYETLHINEFPNSEKDSKLHDGICNSAFIEGKDSSDDRHRTVSANPPSPVSRVKRNNDFARNVRSIPRLYLNPAYNLISLSVATYFWMFLPLVTVIVDYARDKDIPEAYEKFLIYSLTFGDLFGRLAFGWVTDKKIMSLPSFMMLSFVSKGAFMALLPASNSPGICMAVLALAGVPAGTVYVHFPVLIHHYVEEENQYIALGCMGLLSSIASIGISPLIVVKTTTEEMESAGVHPDLRDYCIDKYMEFLACRRIHFPLNYKCKHQIHAYHDCQYEDLVLRMKEYEREKRLSKIAEKNTQSLEE